MNTLDKKYTELLQDILDNGVTKMDRTGTGTLSVFGRQIRHKMSEGFPLLTTKKMYFKGIVTELLWFLRGDTNIKYLVDNDCHIWDGDCYSNYGKKMVDIMNIVIPSEFMDKGWVKVNSQGKWDVLSEEHFAEESYSDYPDSVKNNAKAALKWAEENGWGSCGTDVGKQRANQLAKGEPISVETIKRMYSYLSRHAVDLENSKGYGDGCGKLMYDAWGGKTALSWAESKIRQIERQNFAIQSEEERIISGPLMLADTPIYRNDDNGEYYVVFTKETIKKIAQRFFKKGYQSNVNLMHEQGNLTEGMTMFESWIKDDKRGIKAMKGFEDVPDGSWFGSFKVDNDEVWQMVKDGKVRGFSVEGQFNYRKTGDKRIEQLWENVLGVLAQIG